MYDFYSYFFDKHIDSYQSKENQTYQKIADKISYVMEDGSSPSQFMKELSISQKDEYLFDE